MQGGRPVIRLEVHHLWTSVETPPLRAKVDESFRVLGPKPWQGHQFRADNRWIDMHIGQSMEWRCYAVAKAIHEGAAIASTSWGLGQVLGVHWSRLGFSSPSAFEAAQFTEAGQLDTMVRFIGSSPTLARAIRARDWRAFARAYNGAGKIEEYATKLEAAHTEARRGAT
jgi:hypothetical protein